MVMFLFFYYWFAPWLFAMQCLHRTFFFVLLFLRSLLISLHESRIQGCNAKLNCFFLFHFRELTSIIRKFFVCVRFFFCFCRWLCDLLSIEIVSEMNQILDTMSHGFSLNFWSFDSIHHSIALIWKNCLCDTAINFAISNQRIKIQQRYSRRMCSHHIRCTKFKNAYNITLRIFALERDMNVSRSLNALPSIYVLTLGILDALLDY